MAECVHEEEGAGPESTPGWSEENVVSPGYRDNDPSLADIAKQTAEADSLGITRQSEPLRTAYYTPAQGAHNTHSQNIATPIKRSLSHLTGHTT